MTDETRDLLEDRGGRYPAHMRIREFQYRGTDLVASLWLGNENSGSDVDVVLTRADVDWMIRMLQQVKYSIPWEPDPDWIKK